MSRTTRLVVMYCLGGLFATVALCRAEENPVAGTPSSVESDRLAAQIDLPTGTLVVFYLPTKSGIPDADKETLRRWLDWGRKNIEYLHVRKDLPAWPAAGKIDGNAHIVDDPGLVQLFNGGQQPAEGQFVLSEESIGLKSGERFRIRQQYPTSDKEQIAGRGDTIRWEVPQESPLILDIEPTQ